MPPTDLPFAQELRIATAAVQKAARLTQTVAQALRGQPDAALDKPDATPVTVADLGAQALLVAALQDAFPSDAFLGEESAAMLRADAALAARVWRLVSATGVEDGADEVAAPRDQAHMMDLIDLAGKGEGGCTGRCWVMDPIDGTATYLKGQQYVVALCLLVDGVQRVGVLACPNMSLEGGKVSENNVARDGSNGYLVSAVSGQGACIRPLSWGKLEDPSPVRLAHPNPLLKDLILVENLETTSMDHEKQKQVAEKLGCEWPSTHMWCLQMKYIACAVGGHDAVIRIPREDWHRTCVWDHAGGQLIFEEAGGKVTDIHGKDIDFGAGKRCYNNFGNVIAPVAVHGQIMKVVQEILGQSKP